MTTKHTPTPWEIRGAERDEIYGEGKTWVAMTMGRDRQAANAAFIVRAVNSHDGLVSSVRQLLEALDSMPGEFQGVVARHARARLAALDADNA